MYKKQNFNRIKNVPEFSLKKDFTFNVFSFLLLGLFFLAGIIAQSSLTGFPEAELIAKTAGELIFTGLILTILPLWSIVIVIIIAVWVSMLFLTQEPFYYMCSFVTAGILFAPSLQIILEWEKGLLLRRGKFKTVKGSGITFILPLIDRIAKKVDTRIRVTDFSAEKSLTEDTVPVHVDALAFWMIWDAQKAVLEVENFIEAVTLSAQTALRASIGKNNLSTLLSDRAFICNEIQQILDEKTNPWGISILSVEFTDIIIPGNLEDAMSKVAQAEREKEARVILSEAEVEIAEKFKTASEHYKNNPTSLHLRAMNMAYEGIRKNSSMMVLPSSALDSMNIGTIAGLSALQKTNSVEIKMNNKQEEGEKK